MLCGPEKLPVGFWHRTWHSQPCNCTKQKQPVDIKENAKYYFSWNSTNHTNKGKYKVMHNEIYIFKFLFNATKEMKYFLNMSMKRTCDGRRGMNRTSLRRSLIITSCRSLVNFSRKNRRNSAESSTKHDQMTWKKSSINSIYHFFHYILHHHITLPFMTW